MIRKVPKTKNDYHRPNDTWGTQPDAEIGGGARKVRSLRSQRGMFTLAVTAFTVGALFIVGTSPYNNEFMAPGPLCSSHAQILAGQGADRCAACHGAADQTVASWLTDAFTGGRTIAVSQSELCMKCHEQSISDEFSLNPHNVAVDDLKQRSSKFQQASFTASKAVVKLGASPVNHAGEIACSACHREHHGKTDLTALTDQQCQTCHSQNYHSFETDHPEFTKWPQQRRSAIAFDHATHAGKHFPGKQAEFNCSQCHIDDAHGNVKELASFEQSCAQCHDQQIKQSVESGLAIFALPMIDTEAVERQQLDIGTWPLSATGDFDGSLPPIMRLLLNADDRAAAVLDRLGPNFEFSDVDPDDQPQVRDAVELVWAIKRLIHDLAQGGQSAIQNRLSNVVGREVESSQVEKLADGLSKPVFQFTSERWLPNLADEIRQQNAGLMSTIRAPTVRFDRKRSSRLRMLPVSYAKTPDDLLAENPLKGLLGNLKSTDVTKNEQPSAPAQPIQKKQPKAKAAQTAPTPTTRAKAKAPKQLTLRSKSGNSSTPESELLAVNPLMDLNSSEEPRDSVERSPAIDGQGENPGVEDSAATSDSETIATDSKPEVPRPTRSGWYRDDEQFRVFYLPSGHEDECLKAWSDLAASAVDSDKQQATAALFKRTLSATGIGLCSTCHTVDQLADSSFNVNWAPLNRDPTIRDFTKFSHRPHTLQPHLRDCSGCHDMSQPVSNHESFVGHDSTLAISNFAPITKMNCVSCHRKGQTNNGCTQCHHYHIGSRAKP